MALWAAHPEPQNDELLSSWLVRIAAANYQKLHPFSKAAFPGFEVWNRDVDRLAPTPILQRVSEGTATAIERVKETTLANFEGLLFEHHNARGNCAWILPLGVFHRIRLKRGLQFCPLCLADEPHYFRRVWRLAFVTVCVRHAVVLYDQCPHCQEPINCHRGERGDRNDREVDGAMTRCHLCRGDLLVEAKPKRRRDVVDVCMYQEKWLDALFRGHTRLPNEIVLYSHLFFSGLRILFQNIATGRAGEGIRRAMSIGTWSPDWPEGIRSIERLNVVDRFELALRAGRLLEDWPNRFVSHGLNAGLVSSDLIGQLKSVPFWYFRVIDEHFNAGTYSPTLPEIGNAIEYLRGRKERVTRTAVSRILGVSDAVRKRDLHWMLGEP